MAARLEKHANRLAALLLLLFWGRLLHVSVVKSDTFDEIIHIMQGVLYWQHGSLYPVVENPPLVNALIGLPVSLLLRPQLPLDDPIWSGGNWLRISQVFAWELNDNGHQLIWMGRLTILCLGLLLGALVCRWAGQLAYRRRAGLLALFLLTFDPNVLAHSSLATTDLGTAFFFCLAAYLVWQYWREPGRRRYLGAALGIGLVMAAKFSGLIIVPALGLLATYRLWPAWPQLEPQTRKLIRWRLLELGGWLVLALLVVLAVYRFDLPALAADFAHQQSHLGSGHSSYLLGELSSSGWWYYFPVIFVAKSPLPVLALLALALVLFLRDGDWHWPYMWPLFIAGGIFVASFFSRVNLGYRYLLPALPLLFVFLGAVVAGSDKNRPTTGDRRRAKDFIPSWRAPAHVVSSENRTQMNADERRFFIGGGVVAHEVSFEDKPQITQIKRLQAWVILLLLALVAAASLSIHPDYLAYFNILAGGPENGWRVAVDSNIDWGQDLAGLATYLEERGAAGVQASYLGTAPLAAYGIQGQLLPVWPAPEREPLYDPFYPARPAPGLYALSVTQLLGVYADDPTYFTWFQQRPPDDKVGYSLFIYNVAADGPPVRLALSGIGVGAITVEDFDQAFGSNDVRPLWYDARSSFVWPGGMGQGASWAAVGDGHQPLQPALQALYPAAGPVRRGKSLEGWRYTLFRLDESPVAAVLDTEHVSRDFGWSAEPVVSSTEWTDRRQPLAGKAVFGDTLELLGYEVAEDSSLIAGQRLELISYWRVQQATTAELRVFLHLLDGRGQIVAQSDVLDVRPDQLQPGDEVAQLHTLELPARAGHYALQIGVYDGNTLARLTAPTTAGGADRLLLHAFDTSDGR